MEQSQLIKKFNFSFAVIFVVKELIICLSEFFFLREEDFRLFNSFGLAGDFPYGKGRKNQCRELSWPVKEKRELSLLFF
ncbi:hypothetical protein, partial [Leptospira venezuelensis]|uniref:hypothetical protein n=1 Tax=Leptospira venezuelensis TaxID=1958811 RepID=UPI00197C1FE2